VQQLKAHELIQNLVLSTELLLVNYIELAKCNTEVFQKTGKTKDIKFKDLQGKKRFDECTKDLSVMPGILTLSYPLKRSRDYTDIIRINRFLPSFSITENGISRPKIISCEGSDGKYYQQLVKGGDDMRQDAVMEQVFENVNCTLTRDPEAQKVNYETSI
jgi:phosphatidylinositol kinase/protein kinase (PI-3  family)